jgi:amidohydrolase
MGSDWRRATDEFLAERSALLSGVRRHLHAHPELSREEFQTTQYLARQLAEHGLAVRVAPSGRGLVVESGPEGGARRVAFRADLDALAIHDAKEVPYRSTRPGVMHGCGHDAHATMALGAALALHHARDRLPEGLAWRAIFQPAEEVGEGAREMIAAGALDGVAAVLALHVDPAREVGRVGARAGVLTAFCEELHVAVRGRGAHAARPHEAIDPIAVAALLVTTIYQATPRAVDARDPTVVSFGAIAGGAGANVIPEVVTLLGTLRTLSPETAARVKGQLAAIARGLAEATRAEIALDFRHPIDGVVNDARVTAAFAEAAAEVVGPGRVEPIALPSLGGEDFAAYLAHAPGCLLRLGVAPPDGPGHPLHSPRFDIDERALAIGARVLAHGVVRVWAALRREESPP